MRGNALLKIVLILLFIPFMANAFTLGVITDFHANGNSKSSATWGTIYSSDWNTYLTTAKTCNPQYWAVLGDITTGGQSYATQVKEQLPGDNVIWVKGNHDINGTFTTFKAGSPYYYQDIENWRIIVLDSSAGKKLPSAQFNWLVSSLNTTKKKMILMHNCVWENDSLTKKSSIFGYLHSTFKKYKVTYVFNGHKHDSKVSRKVDGVTYRSFQALSLNGTARYVKLTLP